VTALAQIGENESTNPRTLELMADYAFKRVGQDKGMESTSLLPTTA
jgi:hypothetical protein